MSRLIRAFLLGFMYLSCAFGAPQTAITGQITDSEGAVIANARVLVHWDPSGSAVGLRDNNGIKQDVMVVTDASGHYSANVPPGFYDVFVSAMAFTPAATKVRVKEGQPGTFSPKLNADPLVTKELGHEIYPGSK
jgi:Carboxypeptidase regulatory-like domain